MYHLHSAVCYCGQHYMAYVFMHWSLWVLYDDTHVVPVAAGDVITKCVQRAQASLLFAATVAPAAS